MERAESGERRGTTEGRPRAPKDPVSVSLDPRARKQSLHRCTWSAAGRPQRASAERSEQFMFSESEAQTELWGVRCL